MLLKSRKTFYATQGGAYRGGCTLLIGLEIGEVRYFVRKRLTSPDLVPAQLKYRLAMSENLRAAYFDEPLGGREPFALLHNHR